MAGVVHIFFTQNCVKRTQHFCVEDSYRPISTDAKGKASVG